MPGRLAQLGVVFAATLGGLCDDDVHGVIPIRVARARDGWPRRDRAVGVPAPHGSRWRVAVGHQVWRPRLCEDLRRRPGGADAELGGDEEEIRLSVSASKARQPGLLARLGGDLLGRGSPERGAPQARHELDYGPPASMMAPRPSLDLRYRGPVMVAAPLAIARGAARNNPNSVAPNCLMSSSAVANRSVFQGFAIVSPSKSS